MNSQGSMRTLPPQAGVPASMAMPPTLQQSAYAMPSMGAIGTASVPRPTSYISPRSMGPTSYVNQASMGPPRSTTYINSASMGPTSYANYASMGPPRPTTYVMEPPRSTTYVMEPPRSREPSDPGEVVRRVERTSERTEKDEDMKKWHNVRHFIAYMFTLTAFTVLAAPTVISIQLGMDVDAGFWIGRWGYLALFVPIFLVGQHFYHLWMLEDQRRRRRYIFIIVPVLPAVLFMIIGGTYMSSARHLYGQLKSDDCSSSSPVPAKFWMQQAYDEAAAAYDQCLARLQKDNLGQPLRRHPNLQSCTEWDDLQAQTKGVVPWKAYKVSPGTLRQHNPSNDHRWQYLADVEINHVCGGFCTAGPSLFVSYDQSGRHGGSCAQFVAFRFLSIQHWAIVVFTIGLLIFVLSIATYFSSRNFLTNMGYKSAVTIG